MTDVGRTSWPLRCVAPGSTDVDTATRRRAEYSTDASNYRVVPAGRRLPAPRRRGRGGRRRRRRARRAAHAPGSRYVHGGERRRSGHRRRFLAAPQPGARRRPGRAHRDGRTRRGARRHHRGGRRARAAVRSRPVHPCPGEHRRVDRQQRLRFTRVALRPHRRQRRRTGCADRVGRSAARPRVRPGRTRRRRADRHRVAAGRRAQPCADPHRVRPVPPPGLRLLAGAPAARERSRPRQVPRRQRGHARRADPRDRAAGRLTAGGGARRARLPGHARCGRGGARPAAASPGRARGHGRPAGRGGARAARPVGSARVARRRRLAVRRDRGILDRRGGRGGREADRRCRLPRLGDRHRHPGPGAVAYPRGRRGSRRPHAVGRAGLAGMGGRRRSP